jgi:hypothetical protein
VNLAPHVPMRASLGVDGLAALVVGVWWSLNHLSIISARHWYHDERRGTSWYSARLGGTATNTRERRGTRDDRAIEVSA